MSDEYSCVAKSKLKLKSDHLMKKKKKSKDKNKEKEAAMRSCSEAGDALNQSNSSGSAQMAGKERKLTDAEKKFKKQQEKMRQKRIMEMASTTHKQRVEKFNEHLDSLTEHFDIPKVSWTK